MLRHAVVVGLAVACLSCAPELKRQEVVYRGQVDCGQGADVWEGVDSGGEAAACVVYVRLPAAEGSACRAKLWKYAGAGGALVPVTTNPDRVDATILVTERVPKLRVTCEGQAAGQKCDYEVVKVICDQNPAGVKDSPNRDTLTRVQPDCGADAKTVWTAPEPPEPKRCRVTMRASSSNDCELVLSSPRDNTLIRLPVKTSRLVTVLDPSWVKARCEGNAADQKCLAIVVSTECR
jgi:hypothetical protein